MAAIKSSTAREGSTLLLEAIDSVDYARNVSLPHMQHFVGELIGGDDVKAEGMPALTAIQLLAEDCDRRLIKAKRAIEALRNGTPIAGVRHG